MFNKMMLQSDIFQEEVGEVVWLKNGKNVSSNKNNNDFNYTEN